MSLNMRENRTSLNLKETDSVLHDVDDLQATQPQQQTWNQQHAGSKMEHANKVAQKTTQDLQTLCEGLNNRIAELGETVADAQHFQRGEKVLNALGKLGVGWAKHKALVMRHDRLQTLSLDAAIKEVQQYVEDTIAKLGESEQEYRMDLQLYKGKIDQVLTKLTEANPRFLDAQLRRQGLEAEVSTLEEELGAGTLAQAERPAKQRALEEKQRLLSGTKLEEKTLAAIVKEAQEALPELQKSREAASSSIESLHSMRQGMLEKFDNFRVVLQRATTAMKARVKAEMYTSVDPALNKSIEAVTENNVATAGALMESWAERIKHAAIDPETSQRLLQEMLGHISDAAKSLDDVEAKIKAGPNAPYSNGHDTEAIN